MESGKIKWWHEEKKFGFIQRPNGSDVFVHITSVPSRQIAKGDIVEFDIEDGPKGPVARNVNVITERIGSEINR